MSSLDEVGAAPKPTATARLCPEVGGVAFDPQVIDQVLDPHPWLSAARRDAPVFYMPQYDQWCVTRHEDVLHVLRDPQTFSNRRVIEPQQLPGLERLPYGHPMAAVLGNLDPPEHTRLRKLAQTAFTPRMVATYEPQCREIADRLLDELVERGTVDLLQEYALQVVSETLTIAVGAPAEKARDFRDWSQNTQLCLKSAPELPPEAAAAVANEVVRFSEWLVSFIEDRRLNPRDDYTSLLLQSRSEDENGALTTFEVVRILTAVISAGLETTSSFIVILTSILLNDRRHWDALLADRALVPRAVEEGLRFDGPIRGIRRDAMVDTEIGGVPIPEGAKLYVNYASAGRDEAVFECPHQFDPSRANANDHVAFGKWAHFCLGAPMGKMMTRVAIEALLDRAPGMRTTTESHLDVIPTILGAFVKAFEVELRAA